MRKMLRTTIYLLGFAIPMASAEVVDSAAGGFTTVNAAVIDANRDVVWQAAINEIGAWWSSDHTISGDASRLSIVAVPQGCFCESISDSAGVVHLTVTMVNPGVVIRLTGGLGPLGLMGVTGNMTWEFETIDEGTQVTFTYAVGGYRPGGLIDIAGPVDSVIAEALVRLKAHAEKGDAESASID